MRYLMILVILMIPLFLFGQWVRPCPTRTPHPQFPGTAMTYGNPMWYSPPWPDYGKIYALFGLAGNRFYSWDCSQNTRPGIWVELARLPTDDAYYGASICYFADLIANESFIFCIPGLVSPNLPRNEFWCYHIEENRWYRLEDVPNSQTTIGFGSDICVGEVVRDPFVPDGRAVKIYVLKGTTRTDQYNNEFYVYYFPLGVPVAKKFEILRNTPSRWQRLSDFRHGCNAQMCYVPSRNEIYALRGNPVTNKETIFCYSVRNNTWNYWKEYWWKVCGGAMKTFGVVGNERVYPNEDTLLMVLRGDETKDFYRIGIPGGIKVNLQRAPFRVNGNCDIAFGYWRGYEDVDLWGMWAFFGDYDNPGDSVGFYMGYASSEEEFGNGPQGYSQNFVFKDLNQFLKLMLTTDFSSSISIKIYNSLGELIFSTSNFPTNKNLRSGIYYYQIKSKEMEKRGKLIIKN
ncbi:MAG: T9SS type A sorting domain-containing protein [candidate division WOR-3 bacterium]